MVHGWYLTICHILWFTSESPNRYEHRCSMILQISINYFYLKFPGFVFKFGSGFPGFHGFPGHQYIPVWMVKETSFQLKKNCRTPLVYKPWFVKVILDHVQTCNGAPSIEWLSSQHLFVVRGEHATTLAIVTLLHRIVNMKNHHEKIHEKSPLI